MLRAHGRFATVGVLPDAMRKRCWKNNEFCESSCCSASELNGDMYESADISSVPWWQGVHKGGKELLKMETLKVCAETAICLSRLSP